MMRIRGLDLTKGGVYKASSFLRSVFDEREMIGRKYHTAKAADDLRQSAFGNVIEHSAAFTAADEQFHALFPFSCVKL